MVLSIAIDGKSAPISSFPILQIHFTQREGEFPQIILKTLTEFVSDLSSEPIEVFWKTALLFRGVLKGAPRLQGSVACLYFLAKPVDSSEQIACLLNEMRSLDPWDPQVFGVTPLQPRDSLEGRNELIWCNPKTLQLNRSHLIQGKISVNLTPWIDAKSLQIQMGKAPLDRIQVQLEAHWIQTLEGIVDLFPSIQKHCFQGILQTLTPESLIQDWPQSGESLGSFSHYRVLRSHLTIAHQHPRSIRSQNWMRSTLKGRLLVGWQYATKRRQTVSFELNQEHQLSSFQTHYPRISTLVLPIHLNRSLETASFFHTKAGQKAIQQAYQMAQARLLASLRCQRVRFRIPLEQATSLSLDHQVEIDWPHLGRIQGKIIHLEWICEFSQASAWVTLGCCLGTQTNWAPSKPPKETPFFFRWEDDSEPPLGLLTAIHSPEDWITHLAVTHEGVSQEESLLHNTQDKPFSTRIDLRLRDLSVQGRLEQTLKLQAVEPTQRGPRQGTYSLFFPKLQSLN